MHVLPSLSATEDVDQAKILTDKRKALLFELHKNVVGQSEVIDQLLITLFSGGHGLAKTLLISTLAQALELQFNRVQFTPDLMPSDITGTDVLEEDHATGK